MESIIQANFKTIAIARRYNETHKSQPIAERADTLGITLTLYIYYLDKFADILVSASPREAEILRSQYVQLINKTKYESMTTTENKKHRATKYESDVKCAQCYHSYLLGQQNEDKNFWYYVERHNDLYGIDPQYTAVFNGNQTRVVALMQLRGEQAYHPAP